MRFAIAAALALLALPSLAQTPGQPGIADKSKVVAGTYTVEVNHTQVTWEVNHMNFSMLQGQIGAKEGTLVLDPAKPSATKIDVTFAMDKMSTTSDHFSTHLMSKELFESATYPTARFVSTGVTVNGNKATIMGTLTIKNITKPVTLDATFIGAGTNPNSKKLNIGFRATTSVNRSDFGLGSGDQRRLPVVANQKGGLGRPPDRSVWPANQVHPGGTGRRITVRQFLVDGVGKAVERAGRRVRQRLIHLGQALILHHQRLDLFAALFGVVQLRP